MPWRLSTIHKGVAVDLLASLQCRFADKLYAGVGRSQPELTLGTALQRESCAWVLSGFPQDARSSRREKTRQSMQQVWGV